MNPEKLKRLQNSIAIGFVFAVVVVICTLIIGETMLKKECRCYDTQNRQYTLTRYTTEELDCEEECAEHKLSDTYNQNVTGEFGIFGWGIDIDGFVMIINSSS